AIGRARDRIGVAHPDRLLGGQVLEQRARPERPEVGLAVLADAGAADLPAEDLRHPLLAVADAEHRDAEVEEPGVHCRSARRVDAGWSAGEDQTLGTAPPDLIQGDAVREDLRVDLALADAAGDELRVLSAVIDDEDRIETLLNHR